jgi:hypothetical protein
VSVLRELVRHDIRWQARRSEDRGRLEVVAVVPASATATVVQLLSEAELREPNEAGRRWCRVCSSHDGVIR